MTWGYDSKSLNELVSRYPEEQQDALKKWWGKKLKLASILFFMCGGMGVVVTTIAFSYGFCKP